MAPVWETASAWPRSERPSFKAMMGLPAQCAAVAKRSISSRARMVSRNSRKASVPGSSASAVPISPTERSASLPTEMSLPNPMPRATPRDISVPIRLPLWESTACRPRGKASTEKAAFAVRASGVAVLTTPRLFGPTRRRPCARAISTIRRCRARPSSPISAKPLARMVATVTPASAQAATAASTAGVLTRI